MTNRDRAWAALGIVLIVLFCLACFVGSILAWRAFIQWAVRS